MGNINNKLIVLAGPTCFGKSDVAIELSKIIDAEIVSCDSMQIYKGLDIGTAKATKEEMENIKHYMIDICSPNVNFDIKQFSEMAKECINIIQNKNKIPILVGGTSYYIKDVINENNFLYEDDNLKNTLTFNYSSEILMSNEKSYIIQFLYIAHKFRFFFIASIYLASHSNYSKNDFLDNTTRLTRILLDIQISGYEIFYAFYLFNEIEEAYLYIFMITMSKCYMAFIYDINVIIGYYIRKLVFKEKRLLDNTENDPIPIALSETSSIKNGKKIK